MLVSELWESKFDGLLSLDIEYNYCKCVGNTKTNYMIVLSISGLQQRFRGEER